MVKTGKSRRKKITAYGIKKEKIVLWFFYVHGGSSDDFLVHLVQYCCTIV